MKNQEYMKTKVHLVQISKLCHYLFFYLQAQTYKLVCQVCHNIESPIISESRKNNQKIPCASYLRTNTDQFLFSWNQDNILLLILKVIIPLN